MATRAPDVFLGTFSLGDTDVLAFPLKKNTVAAPTVYVPWAGLDSVTLTFEAPDRSTTFDRSATVYDDAAGIWAYTTLVTDFPDVAANVGTWTVRVKAVDGGITKRYQGEISMEFVSQP